MPRPLPPTLIFLSVHKGASSLLTSVLAPRLVELMPTLVHLPFAARLQEGADPADMPVAPTGMVVTRVYPNHHPRLVEEPVPPGGRFDDKALVVMRRDPRDAAVSLYYSDAFSHPPPPGDAAAFHERRERLCKAGLLDGIRHHTGPQAIDECRKAGDFLRCCPQACCAPYELLVTDPDGWLDRVGRHASWPDRVIEALRPVIRDAVRPPVEENVHRHRRRVRPGNWREVFDDDLCTLFEREIGAEMAAAGYERSGVAAR